MPYEFNFPMPDARNSETDLENLISKRYKNTLDKAFRAMTYIN
jgi:hypothetical protein